MSIKANIIVAADYNGVIGNNGKLPWDLHLERELFKETIKNTTCICGYNTYEEIKDYKLPYKSLMVLTNKQRISPKRVSFYTSWDDLTECLYSVFSFYECLDQPFIPFVIGGADIYLQSFYELDIEKIYYTRITEKYEGDKYFKVPDEYLVENIDAHGNNWFRCVLGKNITDQVRYNYLINSRYVTCSGPQMDGTSYWYLSAGLGKAQTFKEALDNKVLNWRKELSI